MHLKAQNDREALQAFFQVHAVRQVAQGEIRTDQGENENKNVRHVQKTPDRFPREISGNAKMASAFDDGDEPVQLDQFIAKSENGRERVHQAADAQKRLFRREQGLYGVLAFCDAVEQVRNVGHD